MIRNDSKLFEIIRNLPNTPALKPQKWVKIDHFQAIIGRNFEIEIELAHAVEILDENRQIAKSPNRQISMFVS